MTKNINETINGPFSNSDGNPVFSEFHIKKVFDIVSFNATNLTKLFRIRPVIYRKTVNLKNSCFGTK